MNEKQQILNITNMNEKEIKKAAAAFAKRWEGKGYEKGGSQTFWIELLTEVLGVGKDCNKRTRLKHERQ
ncbi:type IIL restriction-modification enzyme MmeI [Prevotella sp.]|uniref:type IIL restriction-modification enzyme MmeI n=1 Tax=Prevotella sp. TaxID=59823 RepID=UPI0030810736